MENLFFEDEYTDIKNKLKDKLLLWSMKNDDKIPENNTVKDKFHFFQK